MFFGVTLNNASDYRANGLTDEWTTNPNLLCYRTELNFGPRQLVADLLWGNV